MHQCHSCFWMALSPPWKRKSDCKAKSCVLIGIKPARLVDLFAPGGDIKGLASPSALSIMARNADTFLLFSRIPLDKSMSAIDNSLYMCREKGDGSQIDWRGPLGRTALQVNINISQRAHTMWSGWWWWGGFLFLLAAELQPLSKSDVHFTEMQTYLQYVVSIHMGQNASIWKLLAACIQVWRKIVRGRKFLGANIVRLEKNSHVIERLSCNVAGVPIPSSHAPQRHHSLKLRREFLLTSALVG